MATVPTYGGPQIERNNLNVPVQREIDVSSGLQSLAHGLGQVGGALAMKANRDAETEANRVDNEVTAGWLEWDAENRKKYQGQNAPQYAEDAKKWWDDAKSKYGGSTNPIARAHIGGALGRKQNQAMASVLGHVNAEGERYADDQAEAAAQSTIDFGVDTGDTAGAAARVRQLSATKGARKGWSTEQVQAEQQRLLGTLHLSVINGLAERDAPKAQAYYDANKGEIPAQVQARVEQVLKAEGDNQFANQFAAQHAGQPLADQLHAAGDITDPEQRKKTIEQVKLNQALVDASQREREQKASDEAWQLASRGAKVPERTLAQMNGRERAQLADWQRAKVQELATGQAVKTNPAALAQIYDMARDDPEAFKKLRMAAISTHVSGADMEQVAKLQRDMLDPKLEKDSITLAQQLGAAVKTLPKQQRGAFQSAANAAIIQFQEEKGRRPNQTERQTVIDDLMTKGVLEDSFMWFIDREKPKFQMTPEERESAVFGTAPAKPAAAPASAPAADKYETGKVYRDKSGNRAKYLGAGKWEPV